MKFNLGKRSFSFSWLQICIYIVLVCLLVSLGCWQLRRGTEKQALLIKQQQQAKIQIQFTAQTPDDAKTLRYKKVTATGHFDIQRQFLLDNQIMDSKAGYFVLTPFILANSEIAILVNRGWIPAALDRKILPTINFKTPKEVTITGRLNTFPSVGIKLAGTEIPSAGFPSLVQVVDSSILAKTIGYSLFSFQLELDPEIANGYRREWQRNTLMSPEKHQAYAVQWFGLALTLSILFFVYASKKQLDD